MPITAAERAGMLAALRSANNGDAVFRPSSATRWLLCTGSTQLAASAPKERRSSAYAREGTAAHFVAQQALEGIRQPDEWSDRMVQLDDKGLDGWFVDEEMVEKVGFYLDEINDRMTSETIAFTEHKMSLGPIDPSDSLFNEVRGTGDRIHVLPRKKVTIIDLKYGRGVPVAANSPQLKTYGIMALVNFQEYGPFDEIEMVIVQPRLINESDWVKPVTFDPGMLMTEFLGEVAVGLEAALEPGAPLIPGEHCRWCPAKTICPAIRQRSLAIAQNLFGPIDQIPVTAATAIAPMPEVVLQGDVVPPGAIVLPKISELDPGEISTILERRALFETWIEGVEKRAVDLLELGTKIPGWKLVQRTGNRRWKEEEGVIADKLRKEGGVKVGDMYTTPKLRSPSQMEKLLSKDKRSLVDPLVERPPGAHTLVRDGDKRAAITSGFTPIEN